MVPSLSDDLQICSRGERASNQERGEGSKGGEREGERDREGGNGNREGERRTDGENGSMFPNITSKPSYTLSSTGGEDSTKR